MHFSLFFFSLFSRGVNCGSCLRLREEGEGKPINKPTRAHASHEWCIPNTTLHFPYALLNDAVYFWTFFSLFRYGNPRMEEKWIIISCPLLLPPLSPFSNRSLSANQWGIRGMGGSYFCSPPSSPSNRSQPLNGRKKEKGLVMDFLFCSSFFHESAPKFCNAMEGGGK